MFGAMRRILRDISSDTRGNTMAIAVAAILLFLAAVGGGIDMSRAYMAKTNLQSACDAGVLAGRKAMVGKEDYTQAAKDTATRMFNFDVKLNETQSTLVDFNSEADSEGAVNGEASINMPTVIMKIFGIDDFDLSVQCSAELQMASADVIFVLDTTGSMSGSKIKALRNAVKEFHKTVAAAVIDKEQTRIRYAFVPYSMTVNVSNLLSSGAMKTDWFQTKPDYQTRVATFHKKEYKITKETTLNTNYNTQYFYYDSQCSDWAVRDPDIISGSPPAKTTMIIYELDRRSGWTCRRKETKVERTYDPNKWVYKFTGWNYKKAGVPTNGLIDSGSVRIATSVDDAATVPVEGDYDIHTLAGLSGTTGIHTSSSRWNGCIEERHTVVDYDMDPIPADAWDLNINDAPTSNTDTQWAPYWGDVEFRPGYTSSQGESCPAPIRQFQEIDTSDPTTVPDWLNTYLDNLVATGSTYHDLGMIWAGRIGSTRGMFAGNVNAGDKPSVSRHIIFMTDGDMDPTISGYSAYGTQYLDGRSAPTSASENGSGKSGIEGWHNNRFLAACREAEAEGYTIWVIAFGDGVSITTQMLDCSTDERAYYASDATELNNTFKFIAGQVADLRIKR